MARWRWSTGLRERPVREEHLVDVALPHVARLAQHPDLVVRARGLALEDVLDEALADLVGLGEHPDLLAALHVGMAEDVLGEVASRLARLAQHPPRLRVGRDPRRGLRHDVGRQQDLPLGGGHYAVATSAARCSPYSSIAASRSLNFCTFPVTVIGNSSTKRT